MNWHYRRTAAAEIVGCSAFGPPSELPARPGLITDRGHPAFVMLNIDEYHRLQGKAPSLFALMQQLPEPPDDVLEIPRVEIEFRGVEL